LSTTKAVKLNNYLTRMVEDKRIDWMIDPTLVDIDGTWMPNKEDFVKAWKSATLKQRLAIEALVQCDTYGELFAKLNGISLQQCISLLSRDKVVIMATIAGRLCNLPSDAARAMYLDNLVATVHRREVHRKEIMNIIKTDKEHLTELAAQIKIDGDGKRDVLKQLLAYGMQTKMHEDAIYDQATGQVIRPAIYTLADPKMAFQSVQELNKMDHEYHDSEEATSSTESQAERIRRLRDRAPDASSNKDLIKTINSAATSQAKALNGTAKKIADRQVLDNNKQGGYDKLD
jgi:hypothetical protein